MLVGQFQVAGEFELVPGRLVGGVPQDHDAFAWLPRAPAVHLAMSGVAATTQDWNASNNQAEATMARTPRPRVKRFVRR